MMFELFQFAGGFGGSRFADVLSRYGILDVFIPFVLIFTISYAILIKTKILGDNKKFALVVALALGMIFITPHITGNYPPESDPVLIINNAVPNVSVIAVLIIMFLILSGLLGWTIGGGIQAFAILASLLAVLFIFGRSVGWFQYLPNWLYFLEDPDFQVLIVIILVFGLVVSWVTSEPSTGNRLDGVQKIMDFLLGKKKD